MTEILIGKIQWPFLVQSLRAMLIGVSAVIRAEKPGG
jgi:hypothetical protein